MEFSIILPARNEAENLALVLRDIRRKVDGLGIGYEIILVDNGSTDNTKEVLSELCPEIPQLKVVSVRPNEGFGNGVIQGLKAARGDILGFIDADGQTEAECLCRSYLKLKKENLDLCVARRIERGDGRLRLFVSRIYNTLFKAMFGGNFGDLGAKPKLFTRSFYLETNPVSKDWFLDTEIFIKVLKGNYKTGEISIIFKSRKKGASKVQLVTLWEFLKNMFYWRFFVKY